MKALAADDVSKLVSICSQPTEHRTMQDLWYIRDRLHECSSFFRLWPPQEQQHICKLARLVQWMRNEVAGQGSNPRDVCFVLSGQAAVAVRRTSSSSVLQDVAMLQPGDTFGEGSLLGADCQPAYVVVRSKKLLALAVRAEALAQAMATQPQAQQESTTNLAATLPAAVSSKHMGGMQIGATKAQQQQQQQLFLQVQQQLLRAAADTQASSLTSKSKHPSKSGSQRTDAKALSAAVDRTRNQAEQPVEHTFGSMDKEAQRRVLPQQKQTASQVPKEGDDPSHPALTSSSVSHHQRRVVDVNPCSAHEAHVCGREVDQDCGIGQNSNTLYSVRHSSIFHVAVTKAVGATRPC